MADRHQTGTGQFWTGSTVLQKFFNGVPFCHRVSCKSEWESAFNCPRYLPFACKIYGRNKTWMRCSQIFNRKREFLNGIRKFFAKISISYRFSAVQPHQSNPVPVQHDKPKPPVRSKTQDRTGQTFAMSRKGASHLFHLHTENYTALLTSILKGFAKCGEDWTMALEVIVLLKREQTHRSEFGLN